VKVIDLLFSIFCLRDIVNVFYGIGFGVNYVNASVLTAKPHISVIINDASGNSRAAKSFRFGVLMIGRILRIVKKRAARTGAPIARAGLHSDGNYLFIGMYSPHGVFLREQFCERQKNQGAQHRTDEPGVNSFYLKIGIQEHPFTLMLQKNSNGLAVRKAQADNSKIESKSESKK
jgi:hypothetical protein